MLTVSKQFTVNTVTTPSNGSRHVAINNKPNVRRLRNLRPLPNLDYLRSLRMFLFHRTRSKSFAYFIS